MSKFIVNVNGKSYEVEVEEMNSVPAQAKEQKPTPAVQTQAPVGGTKITAPMPGTIKKVAVKNGDTVKKNDVVFILEEMKLENEIYAPCDGKITSIATSEGSSVNSGDLLCTIS